MATSGSTSVAVTSHNTLKFSWTLASQSIANNTSTVTWKLELISNAYGAISSTASKNWSVTVNGTAYSGTNTVGIGNSTTKTLASGSTTIAHNSDGTKTFSYSFSQYFGITFSGASVGTKASSGSGTLTTIPRKSTLTVHDGTLGTAQTLTVTKQATSFTHTITYVSGIYSGTIATKSSATSISWTPPMELASGAPYGTSVYVAFTIETFNGSTSIGTNSYAIWCSIPESVKPSVSFAVSDPLGYLSTYGAYVQGKSKFKIDVTASGSYGSSIASYKVVADGKTYSSASVETDVIASSGTLTISVIVTDSRGRTTTSSKTVTVLAYETPKITSFRVERSDSNGVSNATGKYLTVTFSSQVTPLNNNGVGYGVSFKKSSEANYTYNDVVAYKDNFSVTNGKYTFQADESTSYDVILLVADNFMQVRKSGIGPSVFKLFSFFAKGIGIALGKVAEIANTLEVAFDAVFHKNVQVNGVLSAKSKGGTLVDVGNFSDYGFIMAHIPTPTTLPAQSYLPFVFGKGSGEHFSVTDSGEILVGANVSLIRVMACIGGSAPSGRIWAQMKINKQHIYGGDAIAYGTFFTATINSIFAVNEGDAIDIYTPEIFSAGDGGVGCYIYVERIK